ncbi:hypothetical protein F5Y16DRAFT_399020 [Xylariaceae sp. FL0255]|nr:hypothetical protein F5Y16DRAFT_399020 [Xylariaceae sp. FL0255]
MQYLTLIAFVAATFGLGAIAAPSPEVTTLPPSYQCPTGYSTITTTATPHIVCDVVCPKVTLCKSGQPPHTPWPSTTTTLAPSCTVEVIVERPGCVCNTCAPPSATATP